MLSGVVEGRLVEAAETTKWQLDKALGLARIHLQTDDPRMIVEVAKVLATNYVTATERRLLGK
jgi:hypothetical protein